MKEVSPVRIYQQRFVSSFKSQIYNLWGIFLFKGALVYEQLGYKAFGIPGKLAASCSITMQNIGGELLQGLCSCE